MPRADRLLRLYPRA